MSRRLLFVFRYPVNFKIVGHEIKIKTITLGRFLEEEDEEVEETFEEAGIGVD